jgi:hypothetical protein
LTSSRPLLQTAQQLASNVVKTCGKSGQHLAFFQSGTMIANCQIKIWPAAVGFSRLCRQRQAEADGGGYSQGWMAAFRTISLALIVPWR